MNDCVKETDEAMRSEENATRKETASTTQGNDVYNVCNKPYKRPSYAAVVRRRCERTAIYDRLLFAASYDGGASSPRVDEESVVGM